MPSMKILDQKVFKLSEKSGENDGANENKSAPPPPSPLNNGDGQTPSNPNDDGNNNNKNDSDVDLQNSKPTANRNENLTSSKSKSGRQAKKSPGNSLKTIPMRNWKATDLTEDEQKIEAETHIIFSSQQPILPYSKVPCQMKTGNLTEINHELAYFILNDAGDVYQIGLELEKNVGKQLSKSFTKPAKTETTAVHNNPSSSASVFPNLSQVNVDLAPKKLSHRLKIVEIQVGSNGIFAKTIPYKDDKQTLKASEKNQIEKELNEVKKLILSIKNQIAYEKIEALGKQDIETIESFSDLSSELVERVIFQIVSGIAKLYQRYMKENINLLIQSIIESRGSLERVIFLRISLESLNEVIELVYRNYKLADDNLVRLQSPARARLSMEYIKSTYLSNEKQGNQGATGQQSPKQQPAMNQQQKQLQQYYAKLNLIDDIPSKDRVKQEIDRFSQIDKHSSEYNKINTYLDEVFSVPWHKFTPANWNIEYAKKVLDNEIYGLEKVKQRIIEMIAVNQMKNTHAKSKGFVLLLQGPPGTGKTSIAKAVAKALQKQSRFISFAGVSDQSFFKGHRRTYVDSQPGVFVKELIKAQTMNPVLILDEIDKISRNSMGADPYYSLMEILNPEENHNFNDHYMDIKIDFSNTIFILTANNIMNMLEPLKNRLEIIEIPAYIEEEKMQISKKFIIPKAIQSNGINQNLFRYDDQTIQFIIKNWCYEEAGVRSLKRCFETISRKFAVELLSSNSDLVRMQQACQKEANLREKAEIEENKRKQQGQPITQEGVPVSDPNTIHIGPIEEKKEQPSQQIDDLLKSQTISTGDYPTILSDTTIEQLKLPVLDLTKQENRMEVLTKYLGVPSFDAEIDSRQSVTFAPGVVNILSVGGFVGYVMKIECIFDSSLHDKKGTFTATGNLQQVLQESLTIAKINSFNILTEECKKLLSEKNVHIHFMSGSVPKDGPSAGIAICTAYLSLAMNKPVPANIAMTGELSPIGEVCKIGGLQAKIIAAKTLNIDTIICPHSNLGDVEDFPRLLLDGMTIYFVREYNQVYDIVFEEKRGSQVPKGVVVLKNGNFLNSSTQNSTESNNNEQIPQLQTVLQQE